MEGFLNSALPFEVRLEFFESLLRAGSPCRLNAEYPLAFTSNNANQIYVIHSADGPHAGLVTLEREIQVNRGYRARVRFIGSVVTSPTHRHQGLQRQLFDRVQAEAERDGIDFLVLWSNQISFYERLGFFLGGLQASWTPTHTQKLFEPFTASGSPRVKPTVKVSTTDQTEFLPAYYKAFAQKEGCVIRTFEEMTALWKIPMMTVASTPHAYALMGKGEDFRGVIHEWAGPSDEVLACMDALRELEPQARILSPGVAHSAPEQEVIAQLELQNFEARLEYLGLFKIINPAFKQEYFMPETLKYPFFIWGLDSI